MIPSVRSHRPSADRRRHDRRAARGFTLVEILVVVTIIALVAGLVIPQIFGRISGAQRNMAKSEVNAIAGYVQSYMLENGLSRLDESWSLTELAIGDNRFCNEDDLIDPWDNPYAIIIPGEVNPQFDVVSYGADGEPGGEGDAEDIVH